MRRSTSTLMQVATDHAVTGTYVQRFRKNDPREHVVPLYFTARRNTAILSSAFAPVNPLYLFHKLLSTREGAERLLKFFDQTCALSMPESGPPLPVPPEPD
ncbi:hypothetical protein EDB87DRAFT_1684569 [Lactarius vividus]|nr:hypothetical protein EDB87DRAFT_1684569 [Lactarius vividus]